MSFGVLLAGCCLSQLAFWGLIRELGHDPASQHAFRDHFLQRLEKTVAKMPSSRPKSPDRLSKRSPSQMADTTHATVHRTDTQQRERITRRTHGKADDAHGTAATGPWESAPRALR